MKSSREIRAGSFREAFAGEKPLCSTPAIANGLELKISENLVSLYERFASEYGMPSAVLYPCCGCDISPSEVFPSVIYVDQDPLVVQALSNAGKDIYHSDICDFQLPADVDLLLVMNPQLDASYLAPKIKRGHVISNNYHHSAEQLGRDRNLEFIKNLETGEARPPDSSDQPFGIHGYFLFRKR